MNDEHGEPLPLSPEELAVRRRNRAALGLVVVAALAIAAGWAWREWGPQSRPRPTEHEPGAVPEWRPEAVPDPGYQ